MTVLPKQAPQWVLDMLRAEGVDPERVLAGGIEQLGSTVYVTEWNDAFTEYRVVTFPRGKYPARLDD